MNYIKSLFEGRIGRLHYFLGTIIYSIISGILFGILDRASELKVPFNAIILIALAIISIAYIVFALGITVRRIHDLDQSGYLAIITLIPLIGFIYCIYLLIAKGTAGSNTYGDIPKDDFMYNLFRIKNQANTNSTPSQPTTPNP